MAAQLVTGFQGDAIRCAEQICRRLDGIPLAIELAAPRLRVLPINDLATGLDDRFRLLTSGPRSIDRQRTLQASIDWSHELLDDHERVTFRRLAVFAGPFDLADAEAVIAEPPLSRFCVFERVAGLVDKSLVQSVDGRYVLLESIRVYAADKAADAGELAHLRGRHLRHVLDLAARWAFDTGLATAATLDDATRHRADLRLALAWAQAHEPASVAGLLTPLVHVLGAANLWDDLDALVQTAAANEAEGSPTWCGLLAASMHYLSVAGAWWREAASSALIDPGLDIEDSVRRRLRYGLVALEMFAHMPGAADTVVKLVDQAQEDRDDLFVDQVGGNLAYALALGGNPSRAEPYLTWVERHSIDAPEMDVVVRGARGWIDTCRCDLGGVPDEVERLISGPPAVPGAFPGAVVGAFHTGSAPLLRSLRERVQGLEFNGLFEFVPYWIDLHLALLEDDLATAHRAVEQALALPLIDSMALVWAVATEVAISLGDLELARHRAAGALARAENLDSPFPLALATYASAQTARREGDHARATNLALQALDIAHAAQVVCVEVPALEALGLLAAEQGRRERAGHILGACRAFRKERGFLGKYPYLRKDLEEFEPSLDPTHLQAGAARSIDETTADLLGPRQRGDRPVSGIASLTPAERRVVELAVDGLTNGEIADALVVSQATVKTHLVHAYQKLAVRSRAQLVATYLGDPDTPTKPTRARP